MSNQEKSKTVQIEFSPDGGATVHYFAGDQPVGSKRMKEVPKRLRFFLEKFPSNEKEVESVTNE